MTILAPNPKPAPSWQEHPTTLALVLVAFHVLLAVTFFRAWPMAREGHAGAIEVILTGFGTSALLSAGLGWMIAKRCVLVWLCASWSGLFYASSLLLDDILSGNNAGTAVRVGAVATIAFLTAAVVPPSRAQRGPEGQRT